MEVPDKLYHYTSINTLALILKSRKIKFSRLDLVNDPKECNSSDYGSFSQYIFASCWTSEEKESIAMWNIYTPNAVGVRIGLRYPMLKQVNPDNGELISCKVEEKYVLLPNLEPITKIEYTDDEEKLSPKIVGNGTIQPGFLGKFKGTIWQFESEYRYLLYALPHDRNENPGKISIKSYSNAISSYKPLPISSLYIDINPESWEEMEIVLSPKVGEADNIITKSLLNTLNPSAIIRESTLNGKYK